MKYAVVYYNDYDFGVEATMFSDLHEAQNYMKKEFNDISDYKKDLVTDNWCDNYDAIVNCDDENDCWKIVIPKTA